MSSSLEDHVRRELHRAVLERPSALQALSTGDTVQGDLGALVRDLLLPLLLAQGDALVEVARTVDELRGRLVQLEERANRHGADPEAGS